MGVLNWDKDSTIRPEYPTLGAHLYQNTLRQKSAINRVYEHFLCGAKMAKITDMRNIPNITSLTNSWCPKSKTNQCRSSICGAKAGLHFFRRHGNPIQFCIR